MRLLSFFLTIIWVINLPTLPAAQGKPKKPKTKKLPVKRTKWDEMDIGPFQAYGLSLIHI